MEKLQPTLFRVATSASVSEDATATIFDMDGTLIRTKSGARHPREASDWEWMPGVLYRLVRDAAPIIIFTNQSRVDLGAPAASLPIVRTSQVVAALEAAGLAAVAYIAAGLATPSRSSDALGIYRKPWPRAFLEYIRTDATTRVNYIGDAAGRPGDFSDSDRGFAYNIHLALRDADSPATVRFFTPEEYFGGAPMAPRYWLLPDPLPASPNVDRNLHTLVELAAARVIIMVGSPGSGKSTLAAMLAARFLGRTFSNDDHRTATATLAAATAYLATPKSGPAVIDNTHPTAESRAAAAALGPSAVLFLDYPKELPIYLNMLRGASGGKQVPAIAIATYYKRLEPPSGSTTYVWQWQPTINKAICPRYGMRAPG